MLSDKLAAILRSKTSLSPETIAGMSEADGWKAVYSLGAPKGPKAQSICLTGFGQAERDELTQAAAARGIKVVGSVNQGILFLCVGDTPGPSKLAKAASMGIPIATAAELREFLKPEKARPPPVIRRATAKGPPTSEDEAIDLSEK